MFSIFKSKKSEYESLNFCRRCRVQLYSFYKCKICGKDVLCDRCNYCSKKCKKEWKIIQDAEVRRVLHIH